MSSNAAPGGSPAPGQGGAGGTAGKSIKQTTTIIQKGVLVMKEYPITEETLNAIGSNRANSAFWCAVGSLCLGTCLSIVLSVSLAGNSVDAVTVAVWKTIGWLSFIATLITYGAAWRHYRASESLVDYIKRNTVHAEIK